MVITRRLDSSLPKSLWSYNPIPRGCVLYLPLWHPSLSGPVFKSIDPYGHTCTVTGAVYGSTGRTFDGTDDYIVVPEHSALKYTGDTTIEIWFKLTSSTAAYCLLSKDNGGGNRFVFATAATSELRCYKQNDGNAITLLGGTTTTGWHHGILQFGSGGFKIFLDDMVTAVDSDADTNALLTGSAVATQIGTNYAGGEDMNGIIGEVRIYNYNLSQGERQHNQDATKWRYS